MGVNRFGESEYDQESMKLLEKKHQKYDASLWIGILIIGSLLLLYSLYHTGKNIYMVQNWNCIEAEYRGGSAAVYKDEKGTYHSYNLQGYDIVVKDDKIKLYYKDYIEKAIPSNGPGTWVKAYGLSLGCVGISCFGLYRVYHKKKY